MHIRPFTAGLALAATVLSCGAAAADLPTYRLTDLGAGNVPAAINAKGGIAGLTGTTPARYRDGAWTPLGAPPGGFAASVEAINASGEVSGYACNVNALCLGALWTTQGDFVALTDVLPGGVYSWGIDKLGVVGLQIGQQAEQWQDGVFTVVPPPAGAAWMQVGSFDAQGSMAATLFDWRGGAVLARYSKTGWKQLGSLGGNFIMGSSINAAGDIAGFGAAPTDDFHAFTVHGSTLTDIHPAGMQFSDAYGINADGLIVGDAYENGVGLHAYVWIDKLPHDLRDLVKGAQRWTLSQASGIDDEGRIIGYGYVGRQLHGFLLTPVSK